MSLSLPSDDVWFVLSGHMYSTIQSGQPRGLSYTRGGGGARAHPAPTALATSSFILKNFLQLQRRCTSNISCYPPRDTKYVCEISVRAVNYAGRERALPLRRCPPRGLQLWRRHRPSEPMKINPSYNYPTASTVLKDHMQRCNV